MKFIEEAFLEMCADYKVTGGDIPKLRAQLEGRDYEDLDGFHWEFCIVDGERLSELERSYVWGLNAILLASKDIIGKEFTNVEGDRYGIILPCQDTGETKVAVFNEVSAITHKSFQEADGIAEYLVSEGLVVQAEGVYEVIAASDKFIETTAKLASSNKMKLKL